MERLTREMTFEEEYTFLKKEAKELFDKEDRESEPPESHCVVRRGLRCIKKLVAEVEPYKAYKDLDEQGLLLRLPCKVGTKVYAINQIIDYGEVGDKSIYYYSIIEREFQIYMMMDYGKLVFGRNVFLTKAEAEQKLKEMESD